MKGIAYTDAELLAFLPEDLSEYDKMYWLIGDRAYWCVWQRKATEKDHDAMNEIREESLVETNAFGNSGITLLDKGKFSKAAPYIHLDEWTEFVGFEANNNDLENIITDPDLTDFLGPKFFKSLSKHSATSITYIDTWWECFPADSNLLVDIGEGLKHAETNSEKWIEYSKNYCAPIHPQFV
ncbi:MAG: hypothetical protein QM496_14785 [Verrucomicrobiota bacterium]